MKKLFFTVITLFSINSVAIANCSLDGLAVGEKRDCYKEGISARDCAFENSGGKLDWSDAELIGDCVTEKCLKQVKELEEKEKTIEDCR